MDYYLILKMKKMTPIKMARASTEVRLRAWIWFRLSLYWSGALSPCVSFLRLLQQIARCFVPQYKRRLFSQSSKSPSPRSVSWGQSQSIGKAVRPPQGIEEKFFQPLSASPGCSHPWLHDHITLISVPVVTLPSSSMSSLPQLPS